jgi:opacity protein-like surface antigen
MKSSKRGLFSGVAAFCAAIFLSPSPVSGTDLSEFLQKFTPTEECNWAGFYIGLNVGGSLNHYDVTKQKTDVDLTQQFYELIEGDQEGNDGEGEEHFFTTFHTPAHHETDNKTIGGGQTGFNFQFGHFVAGVEGGFEGNGSSAQSRNQSFQENELFLFTLQQNVTAETNFVNQRLVEMNWNGTIGGKFGFCWNRWLFYGTGGAAFTDVHFSSIDKADTSFFGFIGDGDGGGEIPTAPTVRRVRGPRQPDGGLFIGSILSHKERTQGDLLTGWYGGGGIAYQLTDLVSVGTEYRHLDWGDQDEHLMGGNGPLFPANSHLDLTADQILLKVNIIVGPFGH